jgi:hypothetical protein
MLGCDIQYYESDTEETPGKPPSKMSSYRCQSILPKRVNEHHALAMQAAATSNTEAVPLQ